MDAPTLRASRFEAAAATAAVVWCVGALVVVTTLLALGRLEARTGEHPLVVVLVVLGMASFPAVGALIVVRRPGHRMGRLLLAIGVSFSGALVGSLPFELGLGPVRAQATAAIVGGWFGWCFLVLSIGLLPLLFPDGHPPGRRWRPLLLALVALVIVQPVVATLRPGPLEDLPELDNPFGVARAGQVLDTIHEALYGLALIAALASLTSLVVRFRRADATERQQLRWLCVAAVTAVAGAVIPSIAGTWGTWGGLSFTTGVSTVALATGVAVLRYRLYDLGLVLRRTVTYAVLVGLLGAIYAGGVLAVSALARALTGTSSNDLAVAASTLAAAGVARPLGRVLRRRVDRWFARSPYDAAVTVERFARHLREPVDPAAVVDDLERAVVSTLHPARVGVWTPDVSC